MHTRLVVVVVSSKVSKAQGQDWFRKMVTVPLAIMSKETSSASLNTFTFEELRIYFYCPLRL